MSVNKHFSHDKLLQFNCGFEWGLWLALWFARSIVGRQPNNWCTRSDKNDVQNGKATSGKLLFYYQQIFIFQSKPVEKPNAKLQSLNEKKFWWDSFGIIFAFLPTKHTGWGDSRFFVYRCFITFARYFFQHQFCSLLRVITDLHSYDFHFQCKSSRCQTLYGDLFIEVCCTLAACKRNENIWSEHRWSGSAEKHCTSALCLTRLGKQVECVDYFPIFISFAGLSTPPTDETARPESGTQTVIQSLITCLLLLVSLVLQREQLSFISLSTLINAPNCQQTSYKFYRFADKGRK